VCERERERERECVCAVQYRNIDFAKDLRGIHDCFQDFQIIQRPFTTFFSIRFEEKVYQKEFSQRPDA